MSEQQKQSKSQEFLYTSKSCRPTPGGGQGLDKELEFKAIIKHKRYMVIKTLCEKDVDLVLSFEKEKLKNTTDNPVQAELDSWSAPWRKESLEHYLPLGWSFGFFDSVTNDFLGYFLAQPLLFYRGLTQNLWVEHFSYSEGSSAEEMLDVAYRTARSKHFQSVLFYNCDSYSDHLGFVKTEKLSENTLLVKTTKH